MVKEVFIKRDGLVDQPIRQLFSRRLWQRRRVGGRSPEGRTREDESMALTDEAIKEFQAIVKARPDRPDVHFNLATMFQEHGQLDVGQTGVC